MKKIRVLVVDDSALVRKLLTNELNKSDSIEVIDSASDPYEARDKIVKLKPDVLTLDIEMPKMNGIDFLKKLLPQYPIPVIMVSSLTEEGQSITLEALNIGAIDFVTKPSGNYKEMIEKLIHKITIASTVNVMRLKKDKTTLFTKLISPLSISHSHIKIIAIGASTGGTDAIEKIVTNLPNNLPPIVIVQHMPAGFTKMFANRLNQLTKLNIKEAEHNEVLKNGSIYIAPGGKQMRIKKENDKYSIDLKEEGSISGHCPSVDVLFLSIAQIFSSYSIGVILTGMGKDGAKGLKAMFDAGAKTIGQNEETSVVYGMPREAKNYGAITKELALEDISSAIISEFVTKKQKEIL